MVADQKAILCSNYAYLSCFTSQVMGRENKNRAKCFVCKQGVFPSQRLETGKTAPVVIENNVWIGDGVKILKGVIVGQDSVVGIGSVVTRSVPPGSIAAGNPARIIGNVDDKTS